MRRTLIAAAIATAGILMTVPPPPAQAAAASGTASALSPTVSAGATSSPKLISFSPNKGPMGTKVTIIGSGFTGTTKVTFHGVTAVFKVVSSTRITAIVPCGTVTGRIRVITPRGSATSTASFKIT